MSKIDVSSLGLTAELVEAFNSLSAEDQADIAALSDVSDRIMMIESLTALSSSSETLASEELKVVKSEAENITIFTAGGVGLRAGAKIRAYFLGTHHIFSSEFKENWEEYVENDQTYFYNSFFKFKTVDGKLFGIWNYGTLSDLKKMPTLSSKSGNVDPIVEVTYIGKVEGKQTLKEQYGIELTKGSTAHVFTVATNVEFNRYESGVVNSLNAPYPLTSKKSALNKYDATRQNYERIMAAQGKAITGILAQ